MKPVEAWQRKQLTEKLSNIDRKRLTMIETFFSKEEMIQMVHSLLVLATETP